MRRRPGITLIEVLVAIFIMAIGLLAVLTLFPLGALRMSESLQSDRTGAAANEAANICDSFGPANGPGGMRQDPQFDASPNGTFDVLYPQYVPSRSMFLTSPTQGPNFAPGSYVEGYPVYVDPYGVANGSGPLGASAAPNPQTPGIWRVAPTTVPPPYSVILNAGPPAVYGPNAAAVAPRYFTLPDDITFQDNGTPDTLAGNGFVQRGGRYTWGCLLRRRPASVPGSKVHLDVVVYAGRTTAVPGGENTYAAAGLNNDTTLSLTWNPANQPTPNLHRGSWVLDTSYEQVLDPVSGTVTGTVHGLFYRVVTATPSGNNLLNLELQSPMMKQVTAVTVMDNLVDVFDRGWDAQADQKWEFRGENR